MSEQAVKACLSEFLEAFDSLEWERFCSCFSDNASVYFPFPDQPYLADGKSEVEAGFAGFFKQARAKSDGPPYLNLMPQSTRIRVYQDTALVTFHLDRPEGLGRRTLILEKTDDHWKIVHLHASTIPSSE